MVGHPEVVTEASGSGPVVNFHFESKPPPRVRTGTDPLRTNQIAVRVTIGDDPMVDQFKSATATFKLPDRSVLPAGQCIQMSLQAGGVADPSGEHIIYISGSPGMTATPGFVGLNITLTLKLAGNQEKVYEYTKTRLFEVADDGELPPGSHDRFWTEFFGPAIYVDAAEMPS